MSAKGGDEKRLQGLTRVGDGEGGGRRCVGGGDGGGSGGVVGGVAAPRERPRRRGPKFFLAFT